MFAVVRYMGDCAGIPNYSDFIKQNLMAVYSVLIEPNISITQEDIDEFQDEPQTFIKNDLEESDSETRRRQCMKFVQQLSKKFPSEMLALVAQQINTLLALYCQNRA